jgi:glycosyltransferase involved in cell wall biosynthesis
VAYPEADLGDAVVLGALPFPQTVRHMRDAFCVFYAQTTLMETFGLVYAEANAVGTPVLAHPFGSAPEVLCSREQLVDATDPEHVADVLMSWYDGAAPPVYCKDELRLSRVIEEWEALLARTTN